jgi:hypothetical protein
MQNLNMKNAARVLNLAHEYNRSEMKSKTLNFITTRAHNPLMWSRLIASPKAMRILWDSGSCNRRPEA